MFQGGSGPTSGSTRQMSPFSVFLAGYAGLWHLQEPSLSHAVKRETGGHGSRGDVVASRCLVVIKHFLATGLARSVGTWSQSRAGESPPFTTAFPVSLRFLWAAASLFPIGQLRLMV